MTPPPSPPALIAQRVSINQIDVDVWQAIVQGDDGPVVLASGPMRSYEWMVAMLAMAAAAAAAKLNPARADELHQGGEDADGPGSPAEATD